MRNNLNFVQIQNIEIIEGAVCADYVHLCVCIPPKTSISSFMGYLKGKSTLMIYDRHKEYYEQIAEQFLEYEGKDVYFYATDDMLYFDECNR